MDMGVGLWIDLVMVGGRLCSAFNNYVYRVILDRGSVFGYANSTGLMQEFLGSGYL